MKLILESKLPKGELEISHHSKLLSIGSCFADSVGNELEKDGFNIGVNPFGILFDPVSIRKALSLDVAPHIIQKEEEFVSFNFHSSINSASEVGLLEDIEYKRLHFKESLEKTNVIFITFGTAWVHKHIHSDSFIANCHKQPADQFSKELINLGQEVAAWSKLMASWFEQNRELKVVFTVSPVRHSKNGLHQNNISKSVLHLMIHELLKKFESVLYFPAYEIVMDELRDYRFFKEDLVHPTQQGVAYVYQKFEKTYFTHKTKQACDIKRKLNQAKNHRIMNATHQQEAFHLKLIESLTQKFEEFIK